jgi:HAD superfamily hydrolase (TIGR01549 family)
MVCKAVIFDYIGTLVNCRNYSMDTSKLSLYNALVAEGFNLTENGFMAAYGLAHEKYRKVRYEQLKEVTNAIWVAEALYNLGFEVSADDPRIKAALNVFFQDFIGTLELREGAKKLIKQAQQQGKVALISNFTYAPVIYKSLRKVKISEFFDAVIVSEEVHWRKPSPRIFQDALNRLQIKACEAVFIGDSPIEDIKGAKQAGLKTVFVPSQFNNIEDLKKSKQKPDFIANDLTLLSQILDKIFSLHEDTQT